MKDRSADAESKRVSLKEFNRIMRMIKEQSRAYPQAALEDIFLYLEVIEKKYGVENGASRGE